MEEIKKYQPSKIDMEISSKDQYKFSGYASIYDQIDENSDIVVKGAFNESINDCSNIKLLWQHKAEFPIGKIIKLHEDNKGLYVEGIIFLNLHHGSTTVSQIKLGIIGGLSIGCVIQDSQSDNNGHRILKKLDLKEISIVTFPANKYATINKNIEYDEVNKSFQEYNIEKNNMNNIQKTVLISEEFNNFIRSNGNSNITIKSLSTNSEEEGGSFIRQNLYNKIINDNTLISPLRKLANIQNISGSYMDFIIENGEFTSGWVSELSSRDETQNPQLEKKRITVHELYSQPKATSKLLEDSEINVESWLVNQISSSFIKKENESFLVGDGVNQPKGILKNEKIELIQSEQQGKVSVKDILKLINSLDNEYTSRSSFLMHRETLSEIQNYQDNNGRFIWQPAISTKIQDTLFGIPVFTCSFMNKLGSNKLPIIYGDFSTGYTILDRHGINISKDPYTEKPFIKFYAVKRVGGDVLNHNALKILSI